MTGPLVSLARAKNLPHSVPRCAKSSTLPLPHTNVSLEYAMAASTQSTLEGIERRRAQLKDSVEKLRKALAHWTRWEAEYQSLKEEIESAGNASPDQIRNIARNLESSLLDEKEVEELLGKGLKTKRTANQVVDMISRRIDYVQQNSATIEKQLDAAEKKLAGVDVLLEPGLENEDGLPMMDIEEELDEQGNEIGSSLNQTGKAAAEIAEVLRKAGLQKAELEQRGIIHPQKEVPTSSSTSLPITAATYVPNSNTHTHPSQGPPESDQAQAAAKKNASFAEEEQPRPAKGRTALEKDGYNDALADMNFTRGTKVIELDQDDNEIASYPIIPQGESPEDAELRRQMLQYGLSEVGQIVAELDLDQPTVSYSDDEEEDEYDYNTEDDEDEDEYGRTTKPMITEEYRKQMLELEKKLNARMMENTGPETNTSSLAEHAGEIRTMRIRRDEQFDQSLAVAIGEPTKDRLPKKKGVHFADDLAAPQAPSQIPKPAQAQMNPSPTMADTIVERPVIAPEAQAALTKPAKISRFKSARNGVTEPRVLPTPSTPAAAPVPTGPAGRTLASTVLEHTPTSSEPQAPDEFDPITINREIQTEYHKARNRYIQQQGGFKQPDDGEEVSVIEDKDGKTKKVSRFMAARLKADGM
jgi:unconventional prefoldin RPB5 interactor 1